MMRNLGVSYRPTRTIFGWSWSWQRHDYCSGVVGGIIGHHNGIIATHLVTDDEADDLQIPYNSVGKTLLVGNEISVSVVMRSRKE